MVNIIPMAGLGSRFSQEGYLLPKPLIPVSGVPMIINVIRRLPVADKWIFLVRKEHVNQFSIDKVIRSEIKDAVIIEVDETTEGQASTCMIALENIPDDEDVLVAACDNSFIFNADQFNTLKDRADVDCIVWTFTEDALLLNNPKAWGWIKLADDNETIEDISVKIPVSENPYNDHAITATFYFKKASDFKAAYEKMYRENYRVKNEFYVDSIPVFLKKLGKKSIIFDVDLYVGWGTPGDLYYYQLKEHEHLFKKEERGQDNPWNIFFRSKINRDTRRILPEEISRFLVVGFSAVACDFLAYYFLIHFLENATSKAISFLLGTIIAYIFNKNWTFEKKGRNYREATNFILLYTATLVTNVGINQLSLHLLPQQVFPSFLLATGTSTILNFIGQKWWVFK